MSSVCSAATVASADGSSDVLVRFDGLDAAVF
jgi:hypothetical protein